MVIKQKLWRLLKRNDTAEMNGHHQKHYPLPGKLRKGSFLPVFLSDVLPYKYKDFPEETEAQRRGAYE